jgi:hypothetical protein
VTVAEDRLVSRPKTDGQVVEPRARWMSANGYAAEP